LVSWPRIVTRQNISGGPFILRLQHRTLALEVKILEEELAVSAEVLQRRQKRRLLVIVVVALRPSGFRQRWILAIPGAQILAGRQRALDRVGAAIAKRFVKAADAIVSRGDEHQISGRPGIEVSMRKHARHAKFG